MNSINNSLISLSEPSVLILNPLSHKTSCTKCVAYFYEKVPGTDAFGVNYGNTNNFPENRSKTHKINILVRACEHQWTRAYFAVILSTITKKGNIWFMQDHQGDENDDPIVPPN